MINKDLIPILEELVIVCKGVIIPEEIFKTLKRIERGLNEDD